MKIAIAQTEICFEEPEKNLRTAESWIEQAAQEGADAIFFPEMSFTGFSMHVEKVAAYVNPIRQTMCRLAAQEHIAIGYGWTSCKSGGKGENHYTILGKSGEVLSDYVKIHPFSYGGEERFYDSGTEIVHTVLEDFPVSTLICYDLRFPEVARFAATRGCQLLINPAAWVDGRLKAEQWRTLLSARAIENEIFVAGLSRVDKGYIGHSAVFGPDGVMLASGSVREELVAARIDLSAIDGVRAAMPVLEHRRPELY